MVCCVPVGAALANVVHVVGGTTEKLIRAGGSMITFGPIGLLFDIVAATVKITVVVL